MSPFEQSQIESIEGIKSPRTIVEEQRTRLEGVETPASLAKWSQGLNREDLLIAGCEIGN